MISIRTVPLRSLGLLAALGVVLALPGTPAGARNVPGSASAAATSAAEEATDLVVQGIADDIRRLRGDDRPGSGAVAYVSSMGDEPRVDGFDAMFAGSDMALATSLRFRDIDTAELDYGIIVGSALLVRRVNPGTLLFGGLLIESGTGDTPLNAGTMDHDGLGLAVGIDHALSDRAAVQATLGHLWLGYDFTRSGGAVSGSFDARRSFVDVSGEYRFEGVTQTTVMTGGLRYMSQTNDAYLESGGGAVPETTGEVLSAVLGARSTFAGARGMDPFLEVDLRQALSSTDDFPAGLEALLSSDTHGRLGVGFVTGGAAYDFETGVGANFTEDGYSGADAHLRLVLRF